MQNHCCPAIAGLSSEFKLPCAIGVKSRDALRENIPLQTSEQVDEIGARKIGNCYWKKADNDFVQNHRDDCDIGMARIICRQF